MPKAKVERPFCIGIVKRTGKRCSRHARPDTKTCAQHNKTGRPTKFTPDTQAAILDALKTGVGIERAAAFAGIHADSLYNWMKQGKEDEDQNVESEHRTFFERLTRARAEVHVRLAGEVRAAATSDREGDWRAAAWMLERLAPEDFGQRTLVEHEHSGTVDVAHLLGGKQPVDVSRRTREKIDEALAEEELAAIEGTAVEIRE
jgi:transposase-like protein